MNWSLLENEADLNALQKKSFEKPQVIFKHSTRCSISAMAKGRLDAVNTSVNIDFHYLDLIQFRSLSNEIAERFHVAHESPQTLLINQGACILDQSHWDIRYEELNEVGSQSAG